MGKVKCKKCRSTNVQITATDANMKSKASTSVNVNPLKPLTVFNHKEKKKRKMHKGKVAAAAMTGGMSVFATGGLKDNKSREYHCLNCGYVGKAK